MAMLEELMSRLSPEDRAEVEKNAQEMILDYQLQLLREELELPPKTACRSDGD